MNITDQFVATAKMISDGFGLSLFGFDVILPNQRGVRSPGSSSSSYEEGLCNNFTNGPVDLVVVDVNFFPSYKEVPDFPEKLCQYLVKLKQKQKRKV